MNEFNRRILVVDHYFVRCDSRRRRHHRRRYRRCLHHIDCSFELEQPEKRRIENEFRLNVG